MAGLESELAEQRVALDGGLLGHGAGELAPVEPVVGAPAGDELVVGALLDDVALQYYRRCYIRSYTQCKYSKVL